MSDSEYRVLTKYHFLSLNPHSEKSSETQNENELSEKEKKKKEKEEKAKQKLEKKKQMQEMCKQKSKKAANTIAQATKTTDPTIKGEKKDLSICPNKYEPAYVESSWDAWWQKKGFFKTNIEEAKSKERNNRFVMILPPPNVTGSLHLGHTLMGAIEDSIIRYKRLNGFSVIWVPGTDHAGIATQSVVEKKLLKDEGKYRTDFTREEFVKKVWDWKKKYGDRIMEQFTRLGVSFDLSRYFFTMDETRSIGVKEAFIELYERGLLYRDKKMVNWCCALQTAISDVELEELEIDKPTMLSIPLHTGKYEFGVLIDFAYRFKDDPSKEIIVSTTRIETMLGDTAVAVHPKDDRYKDLIGKELIHPFFPDRKMKIIGDDILVDMAFGTGAVKITPAHDPNDFLCGQRHNLEVINIFNDDGTLNENGGEFKGMKRYDCRVAIVKRLTEMNLIKGKHPNKMVLQICSKSGDVIEPMVKAQWWINCKDVAKRTMDDVNSGKLKIIPEFQKQTLFTFLENIRDWCISRQLWWGHQCPIYLVTIKDILDNPDEANNDHWIAAKSEEEAKEKASKKFKCDDLSKISVKQDPDVLDTWFSSGLLPLTCFGWPDKSNDEFKTFFPTDLLETGHDIIFFWVARMIFMSYFFMDTLPFHTVFLHPIVKDYQGRKMSKSLGNVVDPIDVIDGISLEKLIEQIKEGNLPKAEVERGIKDKEKEYPDGIPECGADALRLGLMSYLVQGRNINLDIKRIIGYRTFGNKLWNAFKFLQIYTKDKFTDANINNEQLTFMDKWILNKLSRTIKDFQNNFENYNFGEATKNIYQLWYDNICDVYIEALKCLLNDKNSPVDENIKNNIKNVFLYVIENALIIMHPLMPFITEELFQRLPFKKNKAESICISEFPKNISYIDDEVEKLGEQIDLITHGMKSVLSQFQINKTKPKSAIYTNDDKLKDIINKEKEVIATLGNVGEIILINDKNDEKIKGWLSNVISSNLDVYLDIKDKIDIDKEIERLKKSLDERKKYAEGINNKMNKKDYIKAPENIRKETQEKLDNCNIEIKKIEENIENLGKLK